MLLLAFDTATPAVTVALHDGAGVIAEESAVDARRHGELLAAAISHVLRAGGATPTSRIRTEGTRARSRGPTSSTR